MLSLRGKVLHCRKSSKTIFERAYLLLLYYCLIASKLSSYIGALNCFFSKSNLNSSFIWIFTAFETKLKRLRYVIIALLRSEKSRNDLRRLVQILFVKWLIKEELHKDTLLNWVYKLIFQLRPFTLVTP